MYVVFSTHDNGKRKNHLSNTAGETLCKVEKKNPHLLFSSYKLDFYDAWVEGDVDDTVCKTCLKIAGMTAKGGNDK